MRFVVLFFLFCSSCSYSWRGHDFDAPEEDINIGGKINSDFQKIHPDCNNGEDEIKDFGKDIVVYFSETSSELGKTFGGPTTVAPFYDYTLLGMFHVESFSEIEVARIYFVDGRIDQQRKFVLLMYMKTFDGKEKACRFQASEFSFEEDKAIINMGSFRLVSYDLRQNVEEDFEGVVQIEVESYDHDKKKWVFEGQFSALLGFDFSN